MDENVIRARSEGLKKHVMASRKANLRCKSENRVEDSGIIF